LIGERHEQLRSPFLTATRREGSGCRPQFKELREGFSLMQVSFNECCPCFYVPSNAGYHVTHMHYLVRLIWYNNCITQSPRQANHVLIEDIWYLNLNVTGSNNNSLSLIWISIQIELRIYNVGIRKPKHVSMPSPDY